MNYVCCNNYCGRAYVTIWHAFYLEEECKQNGKAERENKPEYLRTLSNIYVMEVSKKTWKLRNTCVHFLTFMAWKFPKTWKLRNTCVHFLTFMAWKFLKKPANYEIPAYAF